ncbi:hypothetical protein HHK36_001858 [Tetracentron sinense]|uniref:Uncharacterized protein n=1 Tax=Tetracentron sinense TaxID=13715 RepID=A0A834ZTI1_TETSI|nr:hypothetical protein HHK36_001858 [Tetracentron sinense]
MAIRLSLILLLLALALALVAESSSFGDAHWGLTHFSGGARGQKCEGLVGDCIDEEEEMMMESEAGRRTLAQRRKFISYAALRKNNVPCNRRGHSYYNCVRSGRANPYRRGCSAITHCCNGVRNSLAYLPSVLLAHVHIKAKLGNRGGGAMPLWLQPVLIGGITLFDACLDASDDPVSIWTTCLKEDESA